MTENDAKSWLVEKFGDKAMARLERYAELLIDAADRQNLISPSTISQLWSRHIVDSAQLAGLAERPGRWADIGSGAGLPGLVIGIVTDTPITLIEPRRLRISFLNDCIAGLGMDNQVDILPMKAQNTTGKYATISARAVASADQVLGMAAHLAKSTTTFLLPKGVSAEIEVAQARRSWHGVFHVKQSVVGVRSGIIVATGIKRR